MSVPSLDTLVQAVETLPASEKPHDRVVEKRRPRLKYENSGATSSTPITFVNG